MKAYVLPGKESLVQIICDNIDEVILVAGICGESEIDKWHRYNNTFIMSWKVYQYIAYHGLKQVYDKNYVDCITQETYEENFVKIPC